MDHYICKGGCEGVSEKPGTCQAIACPSFGQPLEKCVCPDGKHGFTPEKEQAEAAPKK